MLTSIAFTYKALKIRQLDTLFIVLSKMQQKLEMTNCLVEDKVRCASTSTGLIS